MKPAPTQSSPSSPAPRRAMARLYIAPPAPSAPRSPFPTIDVDLSGFKT
ncbi:hypothetical protein MC7420_6250 [Coleofasciculus chthonoplastes PCC 7420]|uniref:Uncharacterized protein n=1 Tax=Coleofasciculus chthonoplastes PCC 7420 TaxID=118168 RepID=B4VTZ2_9CYAN|nr:hypothetical protein MC7420_6250 [Coleofasciculus chthonoplastes PCC 7420]